MGALVIAGVDAPPVFPSSEHDLDFMASSVEYGVVGDVDFAGMHALISWSASASRNQSASYPLSPNNDLAFGNASVISATPPNHSSGLR